MAETIETQPPSTAASSPRIEGAPTEPASTALTAGSALALSAALAACGGGGGADTSAPAGGSGTGTGGTGTGGTGTGGTGTGGTGTGTGGTTTPVMPTATEASRFLAQASMGASREQMARVQAIGYAAWIDEQAALPIASTRWDYLVANGYDAALNKNLEAGFDACAWSKLLASPDTLRQRVTMAFSEIMVTAIDGLIGGGWRAFSAAAYLDLLDANVFGTHRNLMQVISTSTAMGQFLTYRGSQKANAVSGALPDENYARELMQLFTLGLVQLNADGTPTLAAGVPTYTYGQDDVTGLARVFTGWDFDLAGLTGAAATATPDFMRRPMTQVPARHELGSKVFLGTTIAANTDGVQSLSLALDTICNHANVAPFLSKQLIQRLVTSNPSAAYVQRMSAVFANDGAGVRGNLKALVKAILLDPEARSAGTATSYGKLREPILRFTGWARAWGAASASNAWAVGSTSDPASRLAQSPLRSGSVFNFFRPGYVPPNSPIGSAALVAPEFQITNESSVVGYVNFLQRAVAGQVGDIKSDYTALLAIADDAAALSAEVALVLAANQLSAATLATISTAVASMAAGTTATRQNRIYAALTLVLAAPEFIVQK